MEFFPLMLRLHGREVLIVGGGEIAARKYRLLKRAQPRMRILAPELCAELKAQEAEFTWEQARYAPEHLGDPVLIVAATDDEGVNRQISGVARSRGILANVVDDAASSTAIMPSIVERAPLVIALSSAGASPVLVRRLRDRIEKMLPSAYGRLAQISGAMRAQVRDRLPDGRQRLRFWERVFDGAVAERALLGDEQGAQQALESELARSQGEMPAGEVFLVGVGPGDPDLLTLRAHRLMQLADVVLYDRLIPEAIMDLVRRDAERIDVGKRRANHTLPQEDINSLLVRLAQQGQRVLRLKGGDPFMFGRGGEEIQELMRAGIRFQVVPGVTAALGCSAYAGIPLTHRDHAQTCIFVTGHPRADGQLQLDWDQLARPHQTVVVYMGMTALDQLCTRLIQAGLAADWPVAVVFNGTRPDQQVVTGQLETIVAACRDRAGPGLVIIGQVVTLRPALDWLPAHGGNN